MYTFHIDYTLNSNLSHAYKRVSNNIIPGIITKLTRVHLKVHQRDSLALCLS